MFGKYNVEDFFIAIITINRPVSYKVLSSNDIITKIIPTDSYLTVLQKTADKRYIDLKHPNRLITNDIIYNTINYTIEYIEPLSSYCKKNNQSDELFSKTKILRKAHKYYDTVRCNEEQLINAMEEEEENYYYYH